MNDAGPRYDWNDITRLPVVFAQVKAWHKMYQLGAVAVVYKMARRRGASRKEATRAVSLLLGISARWAGDRVREAGDLETIFERQGLGACCHVEDAAGALDAIDST